MRFFKDHPKEIEAGGAGGDFPPPFRPAVAAAAWPPKPQDVAEARGVEEPKASREEKEEEEEEDEYVSTLPHSPA
jgi:hypothetical protein